MKYDEINVFFFSKIVHLQLQCRNKTLEISNYMYVVVSL